MNYTSKNIYGTGPADGVKEGDIHLIENEVYQSHFNDATHDVEIFEYITKHTEVRLGIRVP